MGDCWFWAAVGAINHGQYVRINNRPLERVKNLVLKVASAGVGSAIEGCMDKPDGQLLATAPVMVNGVWAKFYVVNVEIPATTGRHDLYFVFTHPNQSRGLMNLDSVNFLP